MNSTPRPWRCESLFCLHKPGWWLSIHGVLNCLNCCPPCRPELVERRGTNEDAPLVEEPHSTTPIGWTRPAKVEEKPSVTKRKKVKL